MRGKQEYAYLVLYSGEERFAVLAALVEEREELRKKALEKSEEGEAA